MYTEAIKSCSSSNTTHTTTQTTTHGSAAATKTAESRWAHLMGWAGIAILDEPYPFDTHLYGFLGALLTASLLSDKKNLVRDVIKSLLTCQDRSFSDCISEGFIKTITTLAFAPDHSLATADLSLGPLAFSRRDQQTLRNQGNFHAAQAGALVVAATEILGQRLPNPWPSANPDECITLMQHMITTYTALFTPNCLMIA